MYFEGSENAPNEIIFNKDPNTGQEVFQLKGNKIPKGLISLEKLFDKHDRYVKEQQKTRTSFLGQYEKYNIGTEDNPTLVNSSNWCTDEEKEKFITLLHEYKDVLAYSYEDLKSFRPKEVQHDIRLKFGTVPFHQKQRQYNPNISSTILAKIQKILEASIIFPIHHSSWVANIVVVRKKNGEICICVDFHNLNQLSLKE